MVSHAERVAEELRHQREFNKLRDFIYDAHQEKYWNVRTATLVSAKSVDALVPQSNWHRYEVIKNKKPVEVIVKPSVFLADVGNETVVDDSIWHPGLPVIVTEHTIRNGRMIRDAQSTLFNTYRPPVFKETTVSPRPWIEHCTELWNGPEAEVNYFFDYAAHMVQRPWEKPNAAIVTSGAQGIGKDAAIEPLRHVVGDDNCYDIKPINMDTEQFNGWAQAIIVILNEVKGGSRDNTSIDMYEKLKPYVASPPEYLQINEKFAKVRYVVNVMRLFITLNDFNDLYLPPDDRRHLILHSTRQQGWKDASYFEGLFNYYKNGGVEAVRQWLLARDISKFDPHRIPLRTAAWQAVVAGWTEPEDEVAAVLHEMGRPEVFFAKEMMYAQYEEKDEIRRLIKTPRSFLRRMKRSGYFVASLSADNEYKVGGKRWRARLAAVNERLMDQPDVWQHMLEERGRSLALRLGTATGEDDPDAGKVTRIDEHRPRKGDF